MKIKLSKSKWEEMGKKAGWLQYEGKDIPDNFVIGKKGKCPICGVDIDIIGVTKDNRLIGSCRDAFPPNQFSPKK